MIGGGEFYMAKSSSKYLEDFMKAEIARMHATEAARRMEVAEGEAKREALSEALKIDDAKVLDQLMALELCASSVLALSLIPMVTVAWADWEIQDRERKAIMKAAAQYGIVEDSLAGKILEQWLTTRPGQEIFDAWTSYIKSLAENLDEAALAEISAKTIGRARSVAESAGGFLGLGSKISSAEQAVLDDLEKAFS